MKLESIIKKSRMYQWLYGLINRNDRYLLEIILKELVEDLEEWKSK